MDEILAFYMYPKPDGTYYYKEDLCSPNTVIKIFNFCQIYLALIKKAGWIFLIDHYGYEKLFDMSSKSDWLSCKTIDEFKNRVEYELSNSH